MHRSNESFLATGVQGHLRKLIELSSQHILDWLPVALQSSKAFTKDFSCGDSSKLKQVNIFPLFNCFKGNFLNRTENPFVNNGHWTIFRFYVQCHVWSSFYTRQRCSINLKGYIQVICCQFVLLIHILFENVILTFFMNLIHIP